MIRSFTDGAWTALAAAIVVAFLTFAFAQKSTPAREDTPVPAKTVVPKDSPAKPAKDTSGQTRQFASPTVPAVAMLEIESRFNELQRQLQDDRAGYIDRWLVVITIVLGFLAFVAVVLGYIGFSRFREVEIEAKNQVEAADRHAKDAKRYVDEIREHRNRSQEIIEGMSAQAAADDPKRASRAVDHLKHDPKASPIDKAVGHAVDLQQQGKTVDAAEKWRAIANVVEGTDNDLAARAWFSVGHLVGEERPEVSISANDRAILLKPDLAQAYSNRGVAKFDLGRYEAAIADYDEAIRLRPDLAEPYNNRGNAKYWLGRYEAAITDYDRAIHLRPNYAESYNNRGNAMAAVGRYEAAIADYDEAIRLKPDFVEAYAHRGATKHAIDQHDAAIADYDEAIRLKPDAAEFYDSRGTEKAMTGRHDEAIADYNKAIALRPDFATAYSNRGNARYEMGRHRDAMADYDKAIDLNPEYAEAFFNRGNAKRAMGRYDDAVADYDNAVDLKPGYAEAYGNRGIANIELGRVDEARKDFETARELAESTGNAKMVDEVEQWLHEL